MVLARCRREDTATGEYRSPAPTPGEGEQFSSYIRQIMRQSISLLSLCDVIRQKQPGNKNERAGSFFGQINVVLVQHVLQPTPWRIGKIHPY